jgi:AcrR family transcriptional regulator
METKPHIDLRITKTRWAIRKTFAAMICEMDYEQITIKELAARARINRKTFYLHYPTLGDLLGEMQDKLVESFSKRTSPSGGGGGGHVIATLVKEFFLYTTDHEMLKQRILCSGSYRFIGDKVIEKILRMNLNYKKDSDFDNCTKNIVTTFLASSIVEIYRQWVADGRKIPVEKLIKIASQLICHGVASQQPPPNWNF